MALADPGGHAHRGTGEDVHRGGGWTSGLAELSPSHRLRRFHSRKPEVVRVERLLRAAQSGQGGAMIISGEAGVGKTALLEQALKTVPDLRRLNVAGLESDSEVSFAALHELCVPLLGGLETLPDPQRAALEGAFAMRHDAKPDRFRVGLAVLSLLTQAARERAIVCVVDDAHWIDDATAQVLAFVARRIDETPVALLLAQREPAPLGRLAGLPAQTLGGLDTADALALLSSRIHAPLDEHIRDQIVMESRGNPRALAEFASAIKMARLAGGFGLPEALTPPDHVKIVYRGLWTALPLAARRLVVLAAAEPLGEPVLFWRAAERLGIPIDAIASAEVAELLDVDVRVVFRHPLIRSVVYRASTPNDRRVVHQALAEVTDPQTDPDRRAWHRAKSIFLPDESIAEELEQSAGRAYTRGGVAAAAAFLERAAALSPDPARRAARALQAARLEYQAGMTESAIKLSSTAQAGPLDAGGHALAKLLSAQIATRGGGHLLDAPGALLDAARQLESHDRPLTDQAYLEALAAALDTGRSVQTGRAAETAHRVRAALSTTDAEIPPDPYRQLLAALALQVTDGYIAAAALLRTAIDALLGANSRQERDGHSLRLVCGAAADLWDEEGWRTFTERYVRTMRETGTLIELPVALHCLALFQIHAGEFGEAATLIEEAQGLTEVQGIPDPSWADIALAAWRGDVDRTSALSEKGAGLARERGYGWLLSAIDYTTAVLHNATGRYDIAVKAAQAAHRCDEPFLSSFVGSELVEAAVRAGNAPLAESALDRLAERARLSGNDWALGIEARSRALLSDGSQAENLYREAIDRLGRSRATGHLGRAHLLYGEWLRRKARRRDAQLQLRIAYDALTKIGAAGYAARAADELSACGGRSPRLPATPLSRLTAQELKVARLVADGATSKEAASKLVLSPRTIDAHVRSIMKKLDLTSRRQLRSLRVDLPADSQDTPDTQPPHPGMAR